MRLTTFLNTANGLTFRPRPLNVTPGSLLSSNCRRCSHSGT